MNDARYNSVAPSLCWQTASEWEGEAPAEPHAIYNAARREPRPP